MPDLEQRIQQWRQTLTGALAGRDDAPQVIDELEAHLRDEFEQLTRAGHTPEHAWDAAVARLGDADELAGEFGKVPPPAHAPATSPWLPARVIGVVLALATILFGVWLASRWHDYPSHALLATHVFAVTVGYTTAFAVGASAAWAVLARAAGGWDARHAAVFRSATTRFIAFGLPLTLAGVLLGGWWAYDTFGQFWSWDTKETGGVLVLAWYGLTLRATLRSTACPTPGRSALLLGLLGAVAAGVAWLGPHLLDGGLRPYPAHLQQLSLWLGGILATQALLVGVALLPAGWMRLKTA